MSVLKIGNVVIACEDGMVRFEDPLRSTPLRINYDDFPLLLDLLDSVEWDRRRAFRVPVWSESQLSTVIEYGGDTYEVDAVDISLAGILIDLEGSDAPALSTDDHLSLTLQLNELSTTLSGVVRRCDGRRFGIIFPASSHRQQVNPPIQLRLIVNQLERQWLSKQFHDKREDEYAELSVE